MPEEFDIPTKVKALYLAKGHCQCQLPGHGHDGRKCLRKLNLHHRNREADDAWEAHHIDPNGEATLENCAIFCWPCHRQTFGD